MCSALESLGHQAHDFIPTHGPKLYNAKFDYDENSRCPYGAHIRRCNPRGGQIVQRVANNSRRLIRRGYRDAADTAGRGLLATWGPYAGRWIPPVTLDHVLVGRRIGVREVSVVPVRLSDHRAVIAELTVPVS